LIALLIGAVYLFDFLLSFARKNSEKVLRRRNTSSHLARASNCIRLRKPYYIEALWLKTIAKILPKIKLISVVKIVDKTP